MQLKQNFSRVVNIGSYPIMEKYAPIFCKVEYTNEKGKGKLSISGVIAPMKNGDARGSCGQIYDEIEDNLKVMKFAEGWDKVKALEFVEKWKRWHLNDMHAGCEHQRAFEQEKYEKNEGKKCLKCDYVYGSAWKYEELPYMIWQYFYNLPETKIVPAWV